MKFHFRRREYRFFYFLSALESRLLNRFDVQRYAREAYNMGIRYIGACCGMEPYHVRAIAEEASGHLPYTFLNLPKRALL